MNHNINRLLINIGRGDMAALEALYNDQKSSIYCYILSILADRDAAEDVLQDTFIRIAAAAHSHKPEKNGRAWILRIAHNLCMDRMKSSENKVRPIEDDNDDLDLPDYGGLDFISDTELRDALAGLGRDLKAVVTLHLAAGFTFKEIAGLLGEPQSKIQWKYYNALNQLSFYYKSPRSKGVGFDEV